ncbi:ABC transporter ATP-binding protein [Desulfitobacterium sp. Sab5]|uniref:ABC transporter ATP-binding protein n=1 Tax=Desulfitobacterium nosdiversum TaxID=3375356 RepID=UPI003CE8A0EB
MSYIIRTHELTKVFDNKEVVNNVNINVKQSEIYGFLGPNGAGKTTVMRMIINLIKPTSGEIEIFGERLTFSSYNVLKRIGSIIEYPVFIDHLSGKENLEFHCEYMGYYSPNCVENALEMLELSKTGNKPVRSYSLGMKQRLGLARAVLTKPELLILDEPMNGLDPAGMKHIRDLLKMLCRENGMTILISSHILSEIESFADTIGIISQGKMLRELAMQEIHDINLSYVELVAGDLKRAAYVLTEHLHITNFKLMDNKVIRIYDTSMPSQELSKKLILNDVAIESISQKSETLEDYFLKVTEER